VTFCSKLTGKTFASAVFHCFSFFIPFPGVCILPLSVLFGVCEVQNFWFLMWCSQIDATEDAGLLACLFVRSLTLKMKALRSFQTSVFIYQSSRRNISRDFCTQFPINTARLLFAVCRNIPVWTEGVWFWSMAKHVQFRIVRWSIVLVVW
jgi:hypothetical protein